MLSWRLLHVLLQCWAHIRRQRPLRLHCQTRGKEQIWKGTPASSCPHPSLRPLDDLVTTPKNSSKPSTAIRTTHQHPSGTPGRPSRPSCTTTCPNNSSKQPSPRDRHANCLTHATPFYLPRSLTHVRLEAPGPTSHTQHQSTRAHHLSQLSPRAVPLSFLRSVSIISHVCSATATGEYRPTGNTSPRQTDTSHVHRVRTLSKASTESTTTRYIREFNTRVPRSSVGREERPAPRAIQVVAPAVERWRRHSPTHTAMCGAFNAVLLQEAHDHVPHISDQFNTYSVDGGLAILLNKDTFLPDAVKYLVIEEASQHWLSVDSCADHQLAPPKRSRSARSTCTTWSPRNATLPLRSSSDCKRT